MQHKIFVLLAMLFLHVVDDFGLQGIMCDMKQKAWWTRQTDDPKYEYDYLPVLACHAFSWSFMTMLPVAAYHRFAADAAFVATIIANTLVHAWIDNLKANRLRINLIQDQAMHAAQILATFAICVLAR